MTVSDLQAAYEAGRRRFWGVDLDGADLTGLTLTGASFLGASMRGSKIDHMDLTHVQFKRADLTNASLRSSNLVATDLIDANFTGADLSEVDFTGAALIRTNFSEAVLVRANFNGVRLGETVLATAKLARIRLFHAHLADTDIRPLCDVRTLQHNGPSYIDTRTVIKSYRHPGLKNFLLGCGTPAIFAEYLIDCARAVGDQTLRSMMQSTFISYGGPDERFARKLYDALRAHQVTAFFFPESATVGERIGDEVFKRLQEHDRVILICSRASLDRPGVLHEIRETFDREATDGGATYLLPIMLDDYVLKGWFANQPELAERVGRRVVADFINTVGSPKAFDRALTRLLDALKINRPSIAPLN